MKKILAIIAATAISCGMLTSCGGSQFVGTWKSVAMESDGQKITKDDETLGSFIDGFLTIEIEKGGEGKISSDGETKDIEWENDGDTITITVDGDDQEATLEDDQLVMNFEGEKLYLEKDE
ncbi:MAG: hypothetical protein IJ740_10875 [Ruminococcus sp.]|nr:hypothetical protein [Ruminococcus sp.]